MTNLKRRYLQNGKKVITGKNKISISQVPFIKFSLPNLTGGIMQIVATDTKDNKFVSEVAIN